MRLCRRTRPPTCRRSPIFNQGHARHHTGASGQRDYELEMISMARPAPDERSAVGCPSRPRSNESTPAHGYGADKPNTPPTLPHYLAPSLLQELLSGQGTSTEGLPEDFLRRLVQRGAGERRRTSASSYNGATPRDDLVNTPAQPLPWA